MKRKGFLLLLLSSFLISSMVYMSLNAGSNQEYSMDLATCKKFMDLSRKAVDDGNLALAQAYAQKAVQANPWDKLAWANYNDIIQQMADNGDIPEFGTVVEESKASDAPSAGGGASQLEGC